MLSQEDDTNEGKLWAAVAGRAKRANPVQTSGSQHPVFQKSDVESQRFMFSVTCESSVSVRPFGPRDVQHGGT